MARTTKGGVYKRGNNYWVTYQINGKRFRHVLKTDEGNLITNRKAAKLAADRITLPYTAKDQVERKRLALDALRNAEEQAARCSMAAQLKVALSEMWDRFPYLYNTRGATERPLSPGTVQDNASQWKWFMGWAMNNELRFAENVTPDHAERFRRHLAETGLSGDRQNKIVGLCRVMFRLAGITPNPFDGLRKQGHRQQGRRELTEDELNTVCTRATGEMRTLLAIGLFTGLRLGDASRLLWNEVATDLSSISRIASKTQHTSGKALSIPVHTTLQSILAETPLEGRKGYVLSTFGPMYDHDKAALSRKIQDHFTRCGIETHRPGTGKGTGRRAVVEVGFHSLRHSFVTLCARKNVPLHVVRAIVGHNSPAIQDLYLHASTEDVQKAINTLPGLILTNSKNNGADKPDEQAQRRRLSELSQTASMEAVQRALDIIEKPDST